MDSNHCLSAGCDLGRRSGAGIAQGLLWDVTRLMWITDPLKTTPRPSMRKFLLPSSSLLHRSGLAAALSLLLTSAGLLQAQDNIVALGRVSAAGALVNGASSVGATITPVRNAAGDYTVTLTAAGAFSGTDANDFAIQAAIASSVSGDDTIKADISAVTANTVTIEVQIDDVENNPSGHLAAEADFFFTVFRIPATAVADATTPYLLASGKVDVLGSVVASLGRHGITASAVLNAVGEIEVTLTNPGGFVGDAVNDYVLALTLEGSGAAGYAIRGDVTNVVDDHTVVLTIRTDDVQAIVDAADGVAATRPFFFTVFRTTAMPLGTSDTSALIASVRVDAAGNLLSSGSAFDGGTITTARLATGDYRVTIQSTGAFAGRVAADIVAHATLNQSNSEDDGIMTEVVIASANTLHIDVAVTDVEASGEVEGLATDAGFYLTILDTVLEYQPDLRIGHGPAITQMKGDGLYNETGRGQGILLKLEMLKWSRYHFALEHDGNAVDDIRVTELRGGNKVRTKYFRLSGGRRNVTNQIGRSSLLETDVDPGQVIRYQGWVKYGSPKIRPRQSFRILARSVSDPTKVDAVRVTVRSLPFRPGGGRGGQSWQPAKGNQGGGRGGQG